MHIDVAYSLGDQRLDVFAHSQVVRTRGNIQLLAALHRHTRGHEFTFAFVAASASTITSCTHRLVLCL